MKKKIYLSVVILFLLVAPQVTHASWWNPFSWFSRNAETTSIQNNTDDKITELTKKIEELQKKLDEKTTAPASSTERAAPKVTEKSQISVPVKNSSTKIQTNTSLYPKLTIEDYIKDPSNYIDTGIRFASLYLNDFWAPGDRGGSFGYIEALPYSDSPQTEKLMIKASSSDEYQKIIVHLKKGDVIRVFGIASKSEQFPETNVLGVVTNIYRPVVIAQKIEKCETDCSNGLSVIVYDTSSKSANVIRKTPTVSNGSNNSTQVSVKEKLTTKRDAFAGSQDFSKVIAGLYNQNLFDFYVSQLKSGNVSNLKSYLSMVTDAYQKYIDVLQDFRTTMMSLNSDLGIYKSSEQLSIDQQDDVSAIDTYALEKIAEYGKKMDSLLATKKKYRDALTYDVSFSMVGDDLSELKQYIQTERDNFQDKINSVILDF